MIRYYQGTIFNVEADAIVNTVNTVGVMGAGIALEFALRYPKMLLYYQEKCKYSQIKTGVIDYYNTDGKCIVLFPTKEHFKFPSKLEWIEATKACRILATHAGDIKKGTETWNELFDWYMSAALKMRSITAKFDI